MKKIIMPLAMVLAVAGAFATSMSPTSAVSHSYKVSGDPTCNIATATITQCGSGSATCTVGANTYYSDANCATLLKRQ